jgi:hypothetical protein
MDMLPVAMILTRYAQEDTAFSALPDSPVVPHVERPRRAPSANRPRAALAGMLERAARAVAPTSSCTPAT